MKRRHSQPYVTKPGKHGTLYYYEITYRDRIDPDFGPEKGHYWAYSTEHAEERFYDAAVGIEENFEIVSVKRVKDRTR